MSPFLFLNLWMSSSREHKYLGVSRARYGVVFLYINISGYANYLPYYSNFLLDSGTFAYFTKD